MGRKRTGPSTEVISFRVKKGLAKQIDRQAKLVKKYRAEFVKSLFIPTFEALVEVTKNNGGAPPKKSAARAR